MFYSPNMLSTTSPRGAAQPAGEGKAGWLRAKTQEGRKGGGSGRGTKGAERKNCGESRRNSQ